MAAQNGCLGFRKAQRKLNRIPENPKTSIKTNHAGKKTLQIGTV